MRFRFPFATLLRLRQIAEEREERLLAQITNQMAQSHQTLADLQTQRRHLVIQRERALQQSASAFEIVGFYGQMRQVDDMESASREHLAKLSALREQQMKIFKAAHQETELLSGMKMDQLQDFEKERSRQEQKVMDDSFSSRRRLP